MQNISGKLLRSARNLLGSTQKAFAELLGIQVTTVVKWEADNHPIPRRKVLAIKRLFQKHNIHFNEDIGIFETASHVEHLYGASALEKAFGTMASEISLSRSKEIDVIGLHPSNTIQQTNLQNLARINPKMRVILQSSSLENLQSYAEYKVAPFLGANSIYIYGHRILMISWDPIEVICIDSYTHSIQFRSLFEHIWNTAAPNKA